MQVKIYPAGKGLVDIYVRKTRATENHSRVYAGVTEEKFAETVAEGVALVRGELYQGQLAVSP